MIEEPEAHLHPEVQVQLLKQFVELSKHNIRFIITTHSNYMFNQLNNLILSKDLNINTTSCLLFKAMKSQ
jgi:predicted ATPase